MVPSKHLLAFALTSPVVIAVPGPSVMFAINCAMTIGRRKALFNVAGNAVGVYVQVIAVAFGVGAIVARSVVACTSVKLLGAAYLVFLGVQTIRRRHSLHDRDTNRLARTRMRVVFDGFLVGIAHPKTVVFFMAALPQFIDRSSGHVTAQLLLLGALFPLIAPVSDRAWTTVAGSARNWLSSPPRRMSTVGAEGGAAMIGIGAVLAVDGKSK